MANLTKNQALKSQIRIIGGLYRGKKIAFPTIENLRPTPDRVRETLFNWLMQDVRNARCLDAFAGSGALGFEAFSRGAKEVWMVEASRLAFQSLEANGRRFKGAPFQCLQADVIAFLKNTQASFDIIFLDPPFKGHGELLQECLSITASSHCLVPGGLLYVESPREIHPDADLWVVRKSKKAGKVYYALLEKTAMSNYRPINI